MEGIEEFDFYLHSYRGLDLGVFIFFLFWDVLIAWKNTF